MTLRIAHISDLHFAKSCWSFSQFFSKQWLGNVNLVFARKKDYLQDRLLVLPELFQTLKIQHVIISGDLSTTSQHKEFAMALKFVSSLKEKGFEVITIPGNHDQYTKKAYKNKWFYDYFPSSFGAIENYNLKEHGVAAKQLNDLWWIVALDTALATSLFSSRGLFSEPIEAKLKELLRTLPETVHVILVNHFPFFQNSTPRVWLERGPELQALIRTFPKIKFYLHGHSHRHCIADLRVDGLPIIGDSGSTPHREEGSWNLLEISPQGCTIDVFKWNDAWKKERKVEFKW